MELFELKLYNTAFLGGWREGNVSGMDGHLLIISNKTSFVAIKFGDYGGLTWITDSWEELNNLKANEYRFLHDLVVDKRSRAEPSDKIDLFLRLRQHPLFNKHISANIMWGDTVLDLKDGETFTIDHTHDLKYINRNYFYKHVDPDRAKLHPAPMTLDDFETLWLSKIKDYKMLWDWEEASRPHKFYQYTQLCVIHPAIDEMNIVGGTGANDMFYIEINGKGYIKRSTISAPYHDALRMLIGYVYLEYKDGCPYYHCINKVESRPWKGMRDYQKESDRFILMNEPASFYYNNRATEL
jgi:hypothetical protein